MGTAINGKKIENVYIAGNPISGFVKNGEIIYKKNVIEDITPPIYTTLGIFNRVVAGQSNKYATFGNRIRLFISFPEMLAVNPKVDIYGENGKVTTKELKYSEAAKFYFVEFDITEELKLPQGKIKFKIYGYADSAGNVGKDLNEENVNSTAYPYVIFDSIKPNITIKTGINETIGNENDGYTKISFKINDNTALAEYEINEIISKISASQWGDINNVTLATKGVIEGINILKLRDMAGNEKIKEFKIINN